MVSVGALFVFLCVSAGVLWRRYRAPAPAPASGLATHLATLCALSLGAPGMITGLGSVRPPRLGRLLGRALRAVAPCACHGPLWTCRSV